MYQVPVQRLDRIRTSRKRVKAILTDIGLNSCQDFLKDQKSFDNGEQCFKNTEWNDLTDCYQTKKRKKWCYRTQPLCCSLCWFSCRSWHTFRSHVQRCHDEEVDLASLSPCPACAYISRPDLLARHTKLFHAQPQAAPSTSTSNGNTSNKVNKSVNKTSAPATQAGVRVTTVGPGGDKYSCAACGFHDSLLYVMRKHVLLNHCKSLLQSYYGCHVATPKKKGDPALNDNPGSKEPSAAIGQSKFYCCACKMPAETSEHLLYHLLSSAKHQELQAHIKPLLVEHCSTIAKIAPAGSKPQSSELPHLAPRALQQVVSLVSKGMVNLPPVNGKSAPSKKTVLLATHSQPTALVCSAAGGRQVLLANQKTASGVPVRTVPGQPSCSNKPVSFMVSSGAQGNQIPLTMTMTGPSQGQTQQVLLPAGLTLNLGGKIGSVGTPGQPLVFSQRRAGQIEMQVTTSGQQMVLTQGKATTAGAGAPQTLLSDGKAAGGQSMVLTQGKSLGPSMVLASTNTNSFAAMAPSQSLLIGGQVGSVRPMMLNQGLSIQSQQQGGTLLSSHSALSFLATGNKMGPGQSLMLNQGLSLQSSQSTVRLIPTGNKVNGMPTYTLAAVQMAVPVQSSVAKPPVLVNVPAQPPPAPPVPQANHSPVPTKRAAVSSPTGKAPAPPVPQANHSPVPTKRAAVSSPTGKAPAPPISQANPSQVLTRRAVVSSPTGKAPASAVPQANPSQVLTRRAVVSSPTGKAPASAVPQANPSQVLTRRAVVSSPTGKAPASAVPQANLSTVPTKRAEGSSPTAVPQANPSLPRLRPNRTIVSSPTGKALGVKSLFVTRSASGKLECLHCKSAFSDQGLYQHLLHGMNCLLCPLVFYSFRPLVSHCDEAHSLAVTGNRDQLWKAHRLLATKDCRLVSRTPTIGVKVPKDMLGCKELHLALVPKDTDLEVMHLHLTEKSTKLETQGQPSCPFCTDLRPRGPAADVQHLRRRHHVMHAIHAILKTPAFKCVYCLGVYTEQSSARTISIHVQRCRCAPRSAKEAERRLNPDPAAAATGGGAADGAREGLEAPPTPEPYVDSPPEIPAGLDQRPPSERKLFLNKYFLKTPYPTRKEIEFLVCRLKLSQPEVTSIFSSKRKRCRQECHRRGLRVLLGFDSCHLKSVKHNLIIPQGQMSQGLRKSKDTQTMLVECKQEPPDAVEIVGPFGDHPYAEPLNHPGSLRCKKEEPDRTESGKQA